MTGATTFDKAIRILIETNDLADDVPYPIFETMIDHLIRNSNEKSLLSYDLDMLKMSVKYTYHSHRLLYSVDSMGYWSNTTGCTTNDIVSRLRKIQQETINMHMTFDDVLNSFTWLTTTEKRDSVVYMTRAQSYVYHLKETYKDNDIVSKYLDHVNSKLIRLAMKNEDTLSTETFLYFINTARDIFENSADTKTYDHIPTVKEFNQQQATKSAQWVLEAKDELLDWFNQIVVKNANATENTASLDSYHYPKAYELLTIQPEYLTDKGYRLKYLLTTVPSGGYLGSPFVDVAAFKVTWDRDTNLIKAILG